MSGVCFANRDLVTSLDTLCATTRANPEKVRATSKSISPFSTLLATAFTWLANSRTVLGCFHRGVETLDGDVEVEEFERDVVSRLFAVADDFLPPPLRVFFDRLFVGIAHCSLS